MLGNGKYKLEFFSTHYTQETKPPTASNSPCQEILSRFIMEN